MIILHLDSEFAIGALFSSEVLVILLMELSSTKNQFKFFVLFMKFWLITALSFSVMLYFIGNLPKYYTDYHLFSITQVSCLIVAIVASVLAGIFQIMRSIIALDLAIKQRRR